MKYRKLGNSDTELSVIGAGLMGLSPNVYGATNDEDGIQVIQKAKELGVNYFDTADTYGNGHNERLLAKALGKSRNDVFIASKVGYGDNWQYKGEKPAYIKQAAEASLKRLNTDHIDLYYIHLVDPDVPIEESVGAIADLVKEGKVRYIGLSNGTTPDILERANAVHPISAVQLEYNLWTREPDEAVFPLAKEMGITPVAYSPFSRGMISGKVRKYEDLAQDDIRRYLPRYQPDVFQQNVDIVDKLNEIAAQKGITTAQLTLAWVIKQGVLPIPGTKHVKYLEENLKAADIEITDKEVKTLDEVAQNNHLNGKGANG